MTTLEKAKIIATRDFLTGVLIAGRINRHSVIELVRAEGARVEGLLYGVEPNYKLTEKGLAFLEQWKDLA